MRDLKWLNDHAWSMKQKTMTKRRTTKGTNARTQKRRGKKGGNVRKYSSKENNNTNVKWSSSEESGFGGLGLVKEEKSNCSRGFFTMASGLLSSSKSNDGREGLANKNTN